MMFIRYISIAIDCCC